MKEKSRVKLRAQGSQHSGQRTETIRFGISATQTHGTLGCAGVQRIIYVGRLVEGKGLDDLIWAFATGLDENWTLLLVGAGPLEAKRRKYVSDLNVLDRVVFTGAVSDVRPFLKSAQIFAFCSRPEGFPNALLEAMSQGLCCRSYDCNVGPSDLISNGVNGFLIEVDEKQALRNKFKELSPSPGAVGAVGSCAEKIKEHYCQAVVGERFLEFLKDVLDRQE